MPTRLRPLRSDDRAAIAELVTASGAFTAEEIAIALELVDAEEAEGYLFQVAESDGAVAGYACYGSSAADDGSWDLYWIVVGPAHQRRGIGRALLGAAEEAAAQDGSRRLVVETSSQPSYEGARRFYESNGYVETACVRAFYGPGDDKLVYCKSLER